MSGAHRLRESAAANADPAIAIVPATAGDAISIAELIDLAGEGIPCAIWQHYAPAPQDPMAFGAERAAIGSGNFSWRNVRLAKQGGTVHGMVLAYRLPDSEPDGSDAHPLEVPLLALEAQVPGSFYINAVALYPAARGQGFGRQLMEDAHQLARDAGCAQSSLIVFAHNTRARALYRSLGYRERTRHLPIDHPAFSNLGACLLLVRDLR